jgi:hypothetical protein
MRLHKIRHKLVHAGEPPSGTNLAEALRELDLLVRRLVVRHLVAD